MCIQERIFASALGSRHHLHFCLYARLLPRYDLHCSHDH
jgi:hypothetical protein